MTGHFFKNPIIPGFFPDPSICKAKDGYYLVCSSFEYFPGVPIFYSKNLYSFKQIGYCLDNEEQLNLKKANASDGIYAPTIRYHNDTFYMITTNINLKKHILVTSKNPKKYAWSDPIFIKQEGIDPSLLFDDDGKVYLTTSGNQRIVQSEIDIKTGKKLTTEKVIWKGCGFKFPEGPHLYKIKGTYYLFISEGGTEYNHMITVATSKKPFGKFTPIKNNPILSHAGKIHEIQATGHGDIIQDDRGKWFMVALGIRPNGYPPTHHLGRETFLIPFNFDKNNNPQIKNKEIPLKIPTTKKYINPHNKKIEDNFTSKKLNLWWNFLRFDGTDFCHIDTQKRTLKLKCLKADINSTQKQSFIGLRQRHFKTTFSAILNFAPQDKEQAGICVRMNQAHYYLVVLEKKDNKNILSFKRKIGSLEATEKQVSLNKNKVTLIIKTNRDNYYFYYLKKPSAKPIMIGSGETRYLSTEVAGGFTGVYFGLYATGGCKNSNNHAAFSNVKYLPNQ